MFIIIRQITYFKTFLILQIAGEELIILLEQPTCFLCSFIFPLLFDTIKAILKTFTTNFKLKLDIFEKSLNSEAVRTGPIGPYNPYGQKMRISKWNAKRCNKSVTLTVWTRRMDEQSSSYVKVSPLLVKRWFSMLEPIIYLSPSELLFDED